MQGFPIRASQSVTAGNTAKLSHLEFRIRILLLALANHASFRLNSLGLEANNANWRRAITTCQKENRKGLCTSFQLLGQNWYGVQGERIHYSSR